MSPMVAMRFANGFRGNARLGGNVADGHEAQFGSCQKLRLGGARGLPARS